MTEESPRLSNLANLSKLDDNFDEYDSDVELGPFFDMEDVEGTQMFDDPVLGEEPPSKTPDHKEENKACEDKDIVEENSQQEGSNSNGHGDNVAPPTTGHILIGEDELLKLNRDQLKNQHQIQCQKLSGNKPEMLERLQKALEEKVPVVRAKKKTDNKN